VIGAGYVGLTTAACLAHLGHEVVCGEVDPDKVARLERGVLPIVESGLQPLVDEGLASGRLRFVVGAATAAAEAEFVFLCVPTPQREDGAADLSFVEAVAREIAPALQPGAVVVNKSTMPVGSTRLVARELSRGGGRSDVGVASNPEFLREGEAVTDFLRPSRVVIGAEDSSVAVRVSEIYQSLGAPLVLTDPASAEMIKYASNAFLATKISFINAVANLCEAVGADVHEVALGMGYDPRIGSEFLQPGPGYGGSCFPKDTAALLHTADEAGYDFALLRGVIEVNEEQRERVVAKIRRAVGGSLLGTTVAIWGLTFKAGTDDVRDTPALAVIDQVVASGAIVRAYDPMIKDVAALHDLPAEVRSQVAVLDDPYEAAKSAGVLVVLTPWDEFRWLEFGQVFEAMERPHGVVDARNVLDPAEMRRLGFTYAGIGR
jgi:UDPglucose 6-dehydrogenase